MAAPTYAANVKKSSCQFGAVHTWHTATCGPEITDVPLLEEADMARMAACGFLDRDWPSSDMRLWELLLCKMAPWTPFRRSQIPAVIGT